MAGRIPQQFIDDLTTRVDIVELIDVYVPLKKGGRDYSACCPFHNEKTPSFTVSRNKQFYHCFGCGAHGTAIGFLMAYANMDFIEALEDLASRVGMELPQSAAGSEIQSPTKRLYEVLQQSMDYYRHQFKRHAEGEAAADYLKRRGLSGETAAAFALGFSPSGWNNLTAEFGDDESTRRALLAAGMLIEKAPDRSYDRFRERIMFPIRDGRGRVIAFGGRVLGDESPKYLNSPETAVFHKGRELYGLFEARHASPKLQRLLVVEGYMDVIMLAQHGIKYAVATLGTATSKEHLERMFRVVPEVVFCFDGDRAGRAAAWRALENALAVVREGWQARFMFLPDGEDPDSLVQSELQAGFESRIENAVTLSAFLFDELSQQVDMSSIDGCARLVELARPLLSRVRQGVYRHMLIARLAELVEMPQAELQKLLGEKSHQKSGQRSDQSSGIKAKVIGKSSASRRQPSLIRQAVTLLLNEPSLSRLVGDSLAFAQLQQPGVKLLVEMLDILRLNPHLTTAALLERWRDNEDGKYLGKLVSEEYLHEDGSAGVEKEFLSIISRLESDWKKQETAQRESYLLNKSQTPGALSDAEKEELKQIYGAN